MAQSSASAANNDNPLVVAQKIVAELKGLSKNQQSLAMKFAMETLDLQVPISHAQLTPAPIAPHPAAVVTPNQFRDIKSFTTMKAPKSDQQFAAVVAYFYQFESKLEERKEMIDPATMKEAARLSGRPQVQRWAMTLHNAKNAGYLNAAGDGKFKLSPVGENLVAITLPGNSASGQSGSGGVRKRSLKKKLRAKKSARKGA